MFRLTTCVDPISTPLITTMVASYSQIMTASSMTISHHLLWPIKVTPIRRLKKFQQAWSTSALCKRSRKVAHRIESIPTASTTKKMTQIKSTTRAIMTISAQLQQLLRNKYCSRSRIWLKARRKKRSKNKSRSRSKNRSKKMITKTILSCYYNSISSSKSIRIRSCRSQRSRKSKRLRLRVGSLMRSNSKASSVFRRIPWLIKAGVMLASNIKTIQTTMLTRTQGQLAQSCSFL